MESEAREAGRKALIRASALVPHERQRERVCRSRARRGATGLREARLWTRRGRAAQAVVDRGSEPALRDGGNGDAARSGGVEPTQVAVEIGGRFGKVATGRQIECAAP